MGALLCFALALALTLALVTALALAARIGRFDASLPPPSDGVTYLILGSDSREGLSPVLAKKLGDPEDKGDRADMAVLVRVRPDGSSATVSLPRDLIVSDDDGNPERLALSLLKGPDATARALCRSLDVGVTHVVVVRVTALVDIVDALGGITVTLPHALQDKGALLDLPAGTQRVDGLTALALARSRSPRELVDGEWVTLSAEEGARRRTAWTGQILRDVTAGLLAATPVTQARAAWSAAADVSTDEAMNIPDLVALAGAVDRPVPLPVTAVGDLAVVADGDDALREAGLLGCREP
ncbi:hypothetical protein BW730_16660 [Tessaracoccus aquimaris]|uniref:Cell envelope-related transcriptional attenuator domain-containing protein n=1 Tax=Tessaracoccus aquimaris TaxID=1332264 RepID=A0A1Q2CRZ6_9ACTN|nr:hypothetical protein BW730_16660 [Tessaracoccus aquimaris]